MSNNEKSFSFEIIFNKYKQKVFSLIYHIVKNVETAEDLTQEVFLRVYKSYKRFRQESHIYSWIYKIAMNLALEKIRNEKRKMKRMGEVVSLDKTVIDEDGQEMPQQISDTTDTNPLEVLEKEETHKLITYEIESLPEKYRRIIILREIENLSYEEISKILNTSIDVIGVQLIRAREMLKERLKLKGLL